MNRPPAASDRFRSGLRYLPACAAILLLLAALTGRAQQAPPPSPLGAPSPRTGLLLTDDVVVRLVQKSSGERAFDDVARLSLFHRFTNSDEYDRAAAWMSGEAGRIGLERVAVERFPADGKIEYLGRVMPSRWTPKKGELWLVSPFSLKLASYEEVPLSLGIGSGAADVEAELVDIGEGAADGDYAAGVRGKIVLTDGRTATIFGRAVAREGALGVVSCFAVPEWDRLNRRPGDFPDQLATHRVPVGQTGPGRFAFGISARRAGELRALLRQGLKLRVRAVVEAEEGPGNLEVVTGVIPGAAYPGEEIVVTAHLDHFKPAANDNASGSAVILEMARTLGRMIAEGDLPRPARTVRFLWVPEYDGTAAWLSAHGAEPVKRIANLNFDMVGENLAKTNSILDVSYTSDSNPSFLNGLMASIVDFAAAFNADRYPARPELFSGSFTGTRDRLLCRMADYQTGTDHELFNNLKVGATTLTAWPDSFYHASDDSLDKVDPTQLHRAAVIGLASVTTIAYAGDADAAALARQALLYGRRRIAASEFAAAASIAAAGRDALAEAGRRAANLIAHVHRRERAAVGTAALFARTAGSRAAVEKTAALVAADEAAARRRIEDLAALRAAELGAPKPAAPVPTEAEKRAARLVPSFLAGKELYGYGYVSRVLAKDPAARMSEVQAAIDAAVALMRDGGEPELRLSGLDDAAAGYADGRRSILDIRDAVAAEYAPLPVEALELYFRAFEKAGLMTVAAR